MTSRRLLLLSYLLILSACSKNEQPLPDVVPFSISINPFKDSLTLLPVSFSATVNQQVDSYKWDFGDSSTALGAAPTHVYAKWGSYPIHCYATVGNKVYQAYTLLYIKGDSRIVGSRHFSGANVTYKTLLDSAKGYYNVYTTRNIADTIIEIRAPGAGNISFISSSVYLMTESATVLLFKGEDRPASYLSYFPANDSIFISTTGSAQFTPGNDVLGFQLSSKKR